MVNGSWKTLNNREDLKALSFFIVEIRLSNQYMVTCDFCRQIYGAENLPHVDEE